MEVFGFIYLVGVFGRVVSSRRRSYYGTVCEIKWTSDIRKYFRLRNKGNNPIYYALLWAPYIHGLVPSFGRYAASHGDASGLCHDRMCSERSCRSRSEQSSPSDAGDRRGMERIRERWDHRPDKVDPVENPGLGLFRRNVIGSF